VRLRERPPVGARRHTASLVLGLAGALLPAAPAFAAVCDNIRSDWSPGDGPIGALGDTIFMSQTGFGLVTATLLVMGLVVRHRWIRLVASGGLALMAIPLLLEWWKMPPLFREALAEGCLGLPYVTIAVLLALSAGIFYLALRR
jgi:hypothetical protein